MPVSVQTRIKKRLISKIKLFIAILGFLLFLLILLLLNRPMITYQGQSTVTIPMGTTYKDSSVKAQSILSDKTKQLEIKNDVNTNKAGTYHITYSIKYLNGKIRKKKTVIVKDETKPTLRIDGNKKMFLEIGDTYQEPGYHAVDNNDGDITKNVKIDSNVDSKKIGTYDIVYTVKDASGNKEEVKRTIVVVEKTDPNLKTIYLTFDDGPSHITPQILDVLKSKGAKATFFMIGKHDSYNDIIKRVYDEGHTVAIHSNTHNYQYIYSSKENYFKDLHELRGRLKSVTGQDSNIIRFPGGSSNTVSSFNKGIMSTLTAEVQRNGFYYFDWNIDSGDTGRIGSEAIYQNVISSLVGQKTAVVLMHDYAANQQTADAIGKIIDYATSHGYRFDKITEATPDVHHSVNN